MTPTEAAIEAIVLSAVPYQDHHQLITLFTSDMGLCKGIGSFSRSPKSPLFGCFAPLNHVEVIFRPSKSDLLKIQTGSLLNGHTHIRNSYEALCAGCEILNALSLSQLPHKAQPLLFQLLKRYLGLLEKAKSPTAILSSFRLKLLRHEGLLAVTNQCAQCGKEPAAIAISHGQVVCHEHDTAACGLSEEETALFYALSLSTSRELLQELELSETLATKIARLFQDEFL